MKKFVKILSNLALASLMIGGTVYVASCGNNTKEDSSVAESLAKLISVSESGTKLDSNFTVPAYVGSGDQKTLLKWVSEDETLLTFEREEGSETYTAVVHRPAANSEKEYSAVKFYAVVEYNGQTTNSNEFNVRIRREVSAQELYDEWINNTGVTQNVGGYVIAKIGYVSSYKKANLVLWNPEVSGSYYVYNGYISQDDYNNLALGTYVSAKGATNSIYKGLLEANSGATFTVDSSKTIDLSTVTRTDITKHILDKDLVDSKGTPTTEAKKLQSTYVTLSGFEIKDIKTFSNKSGSNATTAQTIATLTRGGVDIDVIIYEGSTPFAEEAAKAISDKFTSIGKGKRVTVKAVLSWFNAPQLMLTSADDIEACADGYTDDYADYDKSYDAASEALALLKANYNQTTEVELPVSSGDVTISYEVSGDALSYDEATHKLTITAGKEKKSGKVVISALSGTIEYETEIEISAQEMTDEEIVNSVLADIKIDEVSAPKVIELDKKAYNDTVSITYEVVEGSEVASIDADGKLVIIPGTEAKTVKVKATATLGETTANRTIEVSVKALPVTSISDVLAATYDQNTSVYYCVEGYITNIYNTTQGNCYIDVTFDTTKKTLCIFKSYDIYGNAYGVLDETSAYKFILGKKVKFYGKLGSYNKANQLADAIILSVESDSAIDAQVAVNEAAALFESNYAKAAEVTIPEGITATVTAGSSAVVSGQKVTITPTATEEEVSITLTKAYADGEKTATVTFKTKEVLITRYDASQITDIKTIELKYTGTTSTNWNTGDITSKFGITDTNITISCAKNSASTEFGLNKAGNFRLYVDTTKGNGGSLSIGVVDGYAIKSITISYTTSSIEGTVTLVDSTVLTGSSNVFAVLAQEVKVQNTSTTAGAQVQMTSIVIEYGSVTAE